MTPGLVQFLRPDSREACFRAVRLGGQGASRQKQPEDLSDEDGSDALGVENAEHSGIGALSRAGFLSKGRVPVGHTSAHGV